MIPIEILLAMSFALLSMAIYMMYRYFNDIIDDMYCELNEKSESSYNTYIAHTNLCKSYTDNINDKIKLFDKRLEELEKNLKYICMDNVLVVSSTLSQQLDRVEKELNTLKENKVSNVRITDATTKTNITRDNKVSTRISAKPRQSRTTHNIHST